MVNLEGITVFVNNKMAELLGYGPKEMIGKFASEFLAIPQEQRVAETRRALDANKRLIEEYQFRRKDGSIIWTIGKVAPIFDENHKHVANVSMQTDITERKKIEEAVQKANEQSEYERKRLETILELSPSAVVILDAPDGKFSYANKRAMQLYGFDTLGLDLAENVAKVKARRADGTEYPIEQMPVSRSLMFGEEVRNVEMLIERSDGKVFPIVASTAPLRDTHGKITAAIVVFEDITERKKAQSALEESEQIYRTLFDNSADGFELLEVLFDNIGNPVDWVFLKVNKAFELQTCLKEAEVLGKRAKQVVPNIESYWIDALGRVERTGKSEHFVNYNQDTARWFDDFIFKYKEGQVGVLFRDITQRKKAEEKLKSSEIELKEAQAVAHLGSWKWHLASGKPEWSAEMYRIYGVDPKSFSITLESALNLTYSEDREFVKKKQEQVLEKGIPASFDHRIVLPNGELRWVHIETKLLESESSKKPSEIMGTVQDITERKKVEEAIKRQAALIDLSPDAIVVISLEGEITFWSKGAEKLYGWTSNEAIGKKSHELLKTVFPKPLEEILAELTIMKTWAGELIHKTKDGDTVTVESRWLPQSNGKGKVVSVLESNVDITERKKAEEALSVSEEKLRNMIEQSPEIFGIYDEGGTLIQVNSAWDRLWQVPREYVVGIWNILRSKQVAEIGWLPLIKQAYAGEFVYVKEKFFDPSLEPEARGKGRKRWLRSVIYPIKSKQGKVSNVVMMHEDMTERKDLEKQMHENERLIAIGQTAGMVGHDIRNPLQAMTGDAYLIRSEIESLPKGGMKDSISESLNSLEQNIVYVNKIVLDLQDYTKQIVPEYSIADLSDVFVHVFETVSVPKSIDLSINVKKAEKIRTDPMLLQRAITNMVNNSIQAMPNGGKLEICGETKDSKIVVTVADTGVGIPDDIKPKLFTPMMTTKSKGQGFGLAASRRLIEAMEGTISFESEKGKGTKFIIELPINQ